MKNKTLAVLASLFLASCSTFLFSCTTKPELKYTFKARAIPDRPGAGADYKLITASVRSDSKNREKKHISFDPSIYFDSQYAEAVRDAALAALKNIYGKDTDTLEPFVVKKTMDPNTQELLLQWDRFSSGDNPSVIGKVIVNPKGDIIDSRGVIPQLKDEGRVDSMVIWIE